MVIPKKYLDATLKETSEYADTDKVAVPAGFIRDIIHEVKALRKRVSKPRRKVNVVLKEN